MWKALYSLPSPRKIRPSVRTPSTSHKNNFTRRSRAVRSALPGFFTRLADGGAHPQEARKQIGDFGERKHVRAVAQRLIRIGVRFNEYAVGARCDGRARQHGSELALAR